MVPSVLLIVSKAPLVCEYAAVAAIKNANANEPISFENFILAVLPFDPGPKSTAVTRVDIACDV
jgi:hypothetical protein